jgi:hypothetical protein
VLGLLLLPRRRHARHAGEVGRWGKATGARGREWQSTRRGERQAVGRDGQAVGARREGWHGRHTATTTGRRRHALGHLAGRTARETRKARRDTSRESKGWGREAALARLVLRQHRVGMGLALGGIRRGDGVDDGLGLFVADLLVVINDVAQVVASAVVRLAHAHGVVRKVHIAVVAEEFGHLGRITRGGV